MSHRYSEAQHIYFLNDDNLYNPIYPPDSDSDDTGDYHFINNVTMDQPQLNIIIGPDDDSSDSSSNNSYDTESGEVAENVEIIEIEENTADSVADRAGGSAADSAGDSAAGTSAANSITERIIIDDSNEDESNQSEPESSRNYHEPPAKFRRVENVRDEDLDGATCPICLDSWANSGEHRLVALKCGHLFGSECVQRWLKAQSVKERSCPTCKTKAAIKDVRCIYARRLVAVDITQVTTLEKKVENLQAEKVKSELELQKSKIAHRSCALQLEVLRSSLLKSQVAKEPVRRTWRFALDKNLEVCRDGGCRVLTYNCRTYELYVTQRSTNYLFPGYGIRKVSCVDYKLGQFVHLHPKPIRDITYSQPRDLLLSVGLDCCARIVDRGIPSVTINAGFPLWSCSWDYLRSNEFYVGGVGGLIHQYDFRNPSTYLHTLQTVGDMSPVVSLCSTEYGLLSCQLNKCWLWASINKHWEPRTLPVEGPFMSLNYDHETHRAMLSVRPSSNGTERSKLTMCRLKPTVPSGDVIVDVQETYYGSTKATLMSRSAWVKAPDSSWIAAHSESDAALQLHGLEGARSMSLPSSEPAMDVCSVDLNGSTLLASLSDSRLRMYRGIATNYG